METLEQLPQSPKVWRSVYETQDEILEAIKALHLPNGFDADLTFGNGSFWRTHQRPRLCYDIEPLHAGVIKADSTLLPLPPGELGSVVFDPPFLTYVRNGRSHKAGKMALSARFGGYWAYDELEEHYRDTIIEAYRVLRPHGRMVFKCQDIIHNHRMHCTHAKVINMAEIEGFRLLDLFVLPAKHRMPGPPERHAASRQNLAQLLSGAGT